MAITITSINNAAGTAKSYSEVGKDLKKSIWRQTTDAGALYAQTLTIQQTFPAGKDAKGQTLRRTSVTCKIARPIEVVNPQNGATKTSEEFVQAQLILTGSPLSTTMTDTDRKDVVRVINNAITDAYILALGQGEI